MRNLIISLFLSPCLVFGQNPGSMDSTDFQSFYQYFLGEWIGHETGRSGIGKGERTYEFVMNQYLMIHNTSRFEPQEQNPQGEVHQDIDFFSLDRFRKKIVLREFHSEGFVIKYTLDSIYQSPRTYIFNSESFENAPPSFRARLTLIIHSDMEFEEIFYLAPQGKDLEEFLRNRWKLKK